MSQDKMAQQFTDLAELQNYCNSQYELIIELSKKINNLEEERDHLKKLLDQKEHPLIPQPSKIDVFSHVTDEEITCRMQLRMLKELSNERELTLEETKRFEIFTKVLSSIKSKEDNKPKMEDMKEEDLLSMLKED
jgi:hypothetical protein